MIYCLPSLSTLNETNACLPTQADFCPSLSASTHSSPSSIWLTSDALVSFFSTSALHHSLPAHPVGGCASGVWLWKCEVNRRWASGVVFSKRSIYHMISRVKRERHIQSKSKIQLQGIKNKRLVWCDNMDISWHAAYFAANYTVSLFYFAHAHISACLTLLPAPSQRAPAHLQVL